MAVSIPQVVTEDSASGAQVIDGSVVIGSTSNLQKTPSTSGNRTTWTLSGWIKRDTFGSTQYLYSSYASSNYFEVIFNSSDKLTLYNYASSGAAAIITTQVFRDTGWYHIHFKVDSGETAAADKLKLYVNGSEVTAFDTDNRSSFSNTYWNTASYLQVIGGRSDADNSHFAGKMSNQYFIDGQALEPTDFGYTDLLTNTWRPKKFAGSYTTTSINDGTNWSALNTNGNTGIQPWSKAFNGSYGATGGTDFAQGTQGAGLFYWEYATGIPISSSLRVYLMNGYPGWADEGFVCNDNTYSTSDLATEFGTIGNQTGGWMTIAAGVHGGSLEKLGCATSSNSDHQTRVVAVEIDGVVLVDSADWRGVNSFYLPFDGSGPIGRDQSPKVNDWTPVNFGGSTVIPKATGALPILNTGNAGKVATPGLRKDYSPNTPNIVKESGCVHFDGTTDCIYTPDSSDFSVGSGDFTLELWFYRTRSGGDDWLAMHTDGTSANSGVGLHVWSTAYGGSDANKIHGRVRIGSSNINCTGTTVIGTSSWHHAAFVRDGTNLRVYLDGVQEGVTAVSTDAINDPAVPFIVGAVTVLGESGIKGYLSNVRYVVGTCLYPSGTTFKPSQEPLTNVTNTKLLCCQSSTDATAYAVSPAAFTKVGDTYAAYSAVPGYCVLALPLVGSANDLSNNLNSGSTTKVMTAVGNAAAVDISNFYGGSYSFDGTGDGLTCPDNTDFEFGSGDFTVECWVKQNDTSGFDQFVGKYGGSSDGEFIVGKSTNTPCFYWQDAGGNANINATNFTGNTTNWYHMACVRDGDVFTMYINGICENSTTDATTIKTTSNKLTIGIENDESSSAFDGYIQDVRIYKGVAKYTGSTIGTQYFIPASTNPDILPDTPSGVAYSSNLTKVTDGSVRFGAWVSETGPIMTASSTILNITSDTQTFTIEAWIKPTSIQPQSPAHDYRYTSIVSQGQVYASFGYVDDGTLRWYTYDSSTHYISSAAGIVATGQWQHVAVVSNAGSVKTYHNGIEVGSGILYPPNGGQSDDIHIGNADLSFQSDAVNGLISNLRITNTAVYTAAFTSPTEPLTSISGTQLLCCQSNNSATDAAVSPTIPDFYSAGVYLTATTYADRGGSSCIVDNNDSITSSSAGTNSFGLTTAADMTAQQRLDINMGNVSATFFQSEWTLEMFFKRGSTDGEWFVGSADTGGAYTTGWSLDTNGGNLRWNYDCTGGDAPKDTGIAIADDTWYFLRVQRTPSTSQSRLYIEVYDSPTNRIGTFDGTVQDGATHTMNYLKIGDANGNSSNLSADWQFANVMITAGRRRNQAVPTLVSGQRVLDASVTAAVSSYGDVAADTSNPFVDDINAVMGKETSYCTFNPLDSYGTLSQGNLYITGGSEHNGKSSIGFNTGKWYAEVKFAEGLTSKYPGLGFNYTAGPYTTWGQNSATGQVCVNEAGPGPDGLSKITFRRAGVSVSYDGGGNDYFTDTRTFQLALDMDNGKGYIGDGTTWYNSTWNNSGSAGDPAAGTGNAFTCDTSKTWFFWVYANGTDMDAEINFGQKPFKHIPPEGFQPANLANLPSPGVVRPDQYVGVGTYTGTGAAHNINVGFAPDLVWIKRRNGANYHHLFDTVRGNDKVLYGGDTSIDDPFSDFDFNSNGFTIGGTANGTNASAQTYVSWNWKAGGNKNTFNVDDVGYASAAAAGLTGGDITPVAASVGTKQGFSIIQYQGNSTANQSIPHGLTQAPDFSIFKNMDGVSNWTVFHRSMTTTNEKVIYLNTTGAVADYSGSNTWWYQLPGDSLFYVGDTSTAINNGTNDIISYHWHDVPGLQKFGTYEGTELSDPSAAFVYCGFRPAWIMVKNIDATEDWYMWDNKRDGYNPTYQYLEANLYTAENSTTNDAVIDIVSNGFKIRVQYAPNNASTYIYAAFAHQPMNTLYGSQSNAR